MANPKAAKRRRPSRTSLVLRWACLGALTACAFLYYRPIRSYLETRAALEQRQEQVRTLRAENRELERRVAFSTSDRALAVEARRLGYVRPGERLFIVKGIERWRKAQGERATIGGGG